MKPAPLFRSLFVIAALCVFASVGRVAGQAIQPATGSDDSTNVVVVVDEGDTNLVVTVDLSDEIVDFGNTDGTDPLASLEDSFLGITSLPPIRYGGIAGSSQDHNRAAQSQVKHFSAKLARFSAQNVSVAISITHSGRAVAILSQPGKTGTLRTIFIGNVSSNGMLTARSIKGKASIKGRIVNGVARGVVTTTSFSSAFSGNVSR